MNNKIKESKERILSSLQLEFIERFLNGEEKEKILNDLKVTDEDFKKWTLDSLFNFTLKKRKKEKWENMMNRLGDLIEKSISILEESLNSDGLNMRSKVALLILRQLNLKDFEPPNCEKNEREFLVNELRDKLNFDDFEYKEKLNHMELEELRHLYLIYQDFGKKAFLDILKWH